MLKRREIISIFSTESNDPERPPKRPLLGIVLRLLIIFATFFTLSFIATHFLGSKYHPTSEPMATAPSIVVATIVALVMTIYLAKSI
jgi:hypothetical protein